MRSKIALIVSALLVVPIGAAWSGGGPGQRDPGVREHEGNGVPGTASAGDIQHVANLAYPGPYQGGTDLEFGTFTVTKLDGGATGNPVCVADPAQADGCARNEAGEIINQTEERDFAFVGRIGASSGRQLGHVIDITNPRTPVKVADMPCSFYQNDIQLQGNLLLQSEDSSAGSCKRPNGTTQASVSIGISDISNPRAPQFLGRINHSRGAHNATVHPTKPIVYVSDSDVASAGLGNIPIYDFSNPTVAMTPKIEFKLGAHSPHDITFNATGTRAYVAAVSLTYILNTENPIDPQLVSIIPNEGISISHQADPTPDGNFLLVSDELGGGAAGASPGGPVHVYDIADETRPVKIGLLWDDCVGVSHTCAADPTGTPEGGVPISTAHVFRINPDGNTMAIAWYRDGVHVIDFSNIRGAGAAGVGAVAPVGPRTIGRMKLPNANTWSAKMWQERHPGYVFANDMGRGFDVFFVSELATEGYLGVGTIGAGGPQTYEAGAGVTRTDFMETCEASPRTQGVDAWVQQIPAKYAGGTHDLVVTSTNGAVYDPDVFFFDKNCAYVGEASTIAEDNERGPIPEGTAYALIANWWPGPYRFRTTVAPSAA